MRLVLFFSLTSLVALTGCGRADGKVKGMPPKGEPRTVLAVKAGDTPPMVTLRGKLVEKCPVAGCWFRLQDNTGVIKVDTKTAKFVVTDIPLQTTVTVSGKLAQEENEPILQATGLRY
jgi:uncharacterized protein YdeI (BOF family)